MHIALVSVQTWFLNCSKYSSFNNIKPNKGLKQTIKNRISSVPYNTVHTVYKESLGAFKLGNG